MMRHQAVLALAFALCLAFVPQAAFAYYYDYDTANTAQQDIGAYGEPIYGSEIPDGVYLVGARTSSRMCILYADAADCESNVNREQCLISVEGGNITAVFWISKAYTRLYMGTGEAAAAASDETGVNDAPYMVGDPAEGYVPHLYTFPIAALNVPVGFASFDGGNRDIADAKWFTRTVVFTPTDELMQAIEDAKNPQPADGGGDEPDPANPDGESPSDNPEATPSETDGDGGDAPAPQSDEPVQEPVQQVPEAQPQQVVEQVQEEQPVAEPEPEPEATEEAPAPAKRGVLITPASEELSLELNGQRQEAQPVEVVKGLSQAQLMGISVLALLAVGIVARVALYAGSKRKRL